MSEPARKPDIRELVGCALNASVLVMRENAETPLQRVAALGAAQLAVQTGAAKAGLPIAAMDPMLRRRSTDMRQLMLHPPGDKEQDHLAAELGSLLFHVRYAGQQDALPKAAVMFSAWMRYRATMRDVTDTELLTLARRTLHEWLFSRCRACEGSAKQEKTKAGNWVRPRGVGQRNAQFRTCQICHGSGRALPAHPERMHLLGLTREKYDADRWPQKFSAAHAWLNMKIAVLVRPLTAQLGRYKRRP